MYDIARLLLAVASGAATPRLPPLAPLTARTGTDIVSSLLVAGRLPVLLPLALSLGQRRPRNRDLGRVSANRLPNASQPVYPIA